MRYVNVSAGGTWATAATWRTGTNTPTMHATTNIALGVSTTIYSSSNTPNTVGTFTGITGQQCTGFLVWQAANVAGGPCNYTFILQEYDGISSWVTKASQTIASTVFVNNVLSKSFVRIAFDTPYTYPDQTLKTGYYRVGITRASTSLTTAATFAAESTGAFFSYLATDDRTGTPGDGDQVIIAGYNGIAATVTMDATTTIGTFTGTDANQLGGSSSVLARSYGGAVEICSDGILSLAQTATITMTLKGNVYVYNSGTFRDGDGTTALPITYNHTIQTNQNSVNCNYGFYFFNGSTAGFNGISKTSTSLWKTTYVSGVGTSASHLVVADPVNWAINDEITFGACSTDNVNTTPAQIQAKCVTKFIKAVYSTTEYQLSDTAGGAESGLASWTYGNWSTNTRIVNATRNIVFTPDTSSYGTYLYSGNGATTGGGSSQVQHSFNWCEFKGFPTTKGGVYIVGYYLATMNYTVNYNYGGAYWNLGQVTPASGRYGFTGLVFVKGASNTVCNSNQRVDYTDCIAIGGTSNYAGFSTGQMNDFTFTRCIAIGNASASSASFSTSLYDLNTTFTDCEVHGCSLATGAVSISSSGGNTCKFIRGLFGTKGQNTQDANITSYCDVLFQQCTFNGSTSALRVGTTYLGLNNGFFAYLSPITYGGSIYEYYTNRGYTQTSGTSMVMVTNNVSGLTNNVIYNIGTKVVSGTKILCGANMQITNANYYAHTGSFLLPTVQAYYDLSTYSTSGTSISGTSTQTINTIFTPITSNNDINLIIQTNTDAGTPNGDVKWNYVYHNSRVYGQTFKSEQYNTNQVTNELIMVIPTLTTNSYITVTNPVTVAGYTEFTINHSTQTITITASTTMKRLYDYSQYDLTLDANMDKSEWYTTNNGVDFTSTYNFVLNTGVALTGGGSINVGGLNFTKSGTATYDGYIIHTSNREVHVLISNLIAGSRVQVYNTTDNSEIYNDIVAGTSLDYIYTYMADKNIRVRAKYTGVSSADLEYTATGTIGNTGFTLVANQQADTIYSTNNVDGSTVTECSYTGSTVRIYVTDPDGTTNFQRIYNWYQYILNTGSGIANQDSSYFYGISPVEYRFDPSMKIINQNVGSPLTIQGANIAPSSGTASIIDNTNGACTIIYSYFPVDASNKLINLDAPISTAIQTTKNMTILAKNT